MQVPEGYAVAYGVEENGDINQVTFRVTGKIFYSLEEAQEYANSIKPGV